MTSRRACCLETDTHSELDFLQTCLSLEINAIEIVSLIKNESNPVSQHARTHTRKLKVIGRWIKDQVNLNIGV